MAKRRGPMTVGTGPGAATPTQTPTIQVDRPDLANLTGNSLKWETAVEAKPVTGIPDPPPRVPVEMTPIGPKPFHLNPPETPVTPPRQPASPPTYPSGGDLLPGKLLGVDSVRVEPAPSAPYDGPVLVQECAGPPDELAVIEAFVERITTLLAKPELGKRVSRPLLLGYGLDISRLPSDIKDKLTAQREEAIGDTATQVARGKVLRTWKRPYNERALVGLLTAISTMEVLTKLIDDAVVGE